MLQFGQNDGPGPKCYFTSSTLPAFVDRQQIPKKKRPFSMIAEGKSVHTVEVVLRREAADALLQNPEESRGPSSHKYAKVYMNLAQIVSGEFFNQYIKTGNIIMLSEGRRGIDTFFTLIDGILRLEVDKATFERLGLEGKVIPTPGRKHGKVRYAIELNLRLPSMVRGKKSFERILYAFKNVLDYSVTWLFCDLRGDVDGQAAIAEYQPMVKTVEPLVIDLDSVVVPRFPEEIGEHDEALAEEFLEWVSLVNVDSPRVRDGNRIDGYLSRYEIPSFNNNADTEQPRTIVTDLKQIRWHGLLTAEFVLNAYLMALKAAGDGWFTLIATAFDGQTYTILQDKRHTMAWEYTA